MALEIVGDNLALVVFKVAGHFDKLFIFDWKAGHTKLHHEATAAYDGRYQISIIDFNPYNIHNVPSDLPGKLIVERRGTLLSHGNTFAEDIEMGLGCIVYTAPEVYDFDGLLVEEERLVGVKTNPFWRIQKILVLYFG
ncbi:hypothetical protein AX14_005391 [Amanita brunnescens Koide BX004]|nr:hypothetical protein AX14_005391 [Amanita brunnescens Koide BX004]